MREGQRHQWPYREYGEEGKLSGRYVGRGLGNVPIHSFAFSAHSLKSPSLVFLKQGDV